MKKLRIILFNLLLLFLLLCAAEWFFGKTHPGLKGHSSLLSRCVPLREAGQPNGRFFVEPNAYEVRESDNLVDKPYLIELDTEGFILSRYRHVSPRFSMVFLGGSTTKCEFVDDSLRFPSLVGQYFTETGMLVNTANSGEKGNHTLNCLNMLVNKCLYGKFHVALLMENVNDLSSLLYFKDYYCQDDRFAKRNISTAVHVGKRSNNFSYFESYSLVFRIKKAFQLFFPNIYGGLYNAKARMHKLPDIPEFEEMTPHILQDRHYEFYKNNLTTFVAICRANQIMPVLMTQFNRITEAELEGNPTFQYYEKKLKTNGISAQAYCEQYRRMNNIMREVAAKEQVLLIDLDKKIPKSKAYLYDLVHLTSEGSKLAASIIFEDINRALPGGKLN